jgi:hypothetical protein
VFDLKMFMKEYNLTQKSLAEVLGKHPSSISAAIGGNFDIPQKWIDDIVKHFNLKSIDKYIIDDPTPDMVSDVVEDIPYGKNHYLTIIEDQTATIKTLTHTNAKLVEMVMARHSELSHN